MISIVIPLFNKAHTIRRTLLSVFSQNFNDFEVIVVNDGSTDNSLGVLSEFLKDNRLKVISQDNQGVSAARNKGVEAAVYDYIAFLDGDDEWLPDYLRTVAKAIRLFPSAGMVCCAGIVKDSRSESLRIDTRFKEIISEIEYFQNPHVYSHISATVVSKSAFNSIGGFIVNMKVNEDFAFMFSVACNYSVVYCGFPLSIYWGGVEGQVTSQLGFSRYRDLAKRINLCHSFWIESYLKPELFDVFEKYEFRHIVLGFVKGKHYSELHEFLGHISPLVLDGFSNIEIFLWRSRRLAFFAKSMIFYKKLLWRMNRFPRVRRA